MYISSAMQNARCLTEVIQLINNAPLTEGMENIEFSADELAGQYAWDCSKELELTDNDISCTLYFIEDLGAVFDNQKAVEHPKKLIGN